MLQEESKDLDADMRKRMASFRSNFWRDRNFTVDAKTLHYTHLREHRFVDMKSRKTLKGSRNKKYYAVHNRPIFGHANEIVKQLTVGFTDGVREQMEQMDGQRI